MPWLKKAAEAPKNEKVWELSDFLYRLYDSSLHYCAEKLTDGHIPASRVTTLTPRPATKQQIEALVTRRLWHRLPSLTCQSCLALRKRHQAAELPRGGFLIHDYLEFNPSKVEWERRQERLRSGGKKGAASRWGDGSGHENDGLSHDPVDGSGHSSSHGSGHSSSHEGQNADIEGERGEAVDGSGHSSRDGLDLWPVSRTPYPGTDRSVPRARASEPLDPEPVDDPPEDRHPRATGSVDPEVRGGARPGRGLRHIGEALGGGAR